MLENVKMRGGHSVIPVTADVLRTKQIMLINIFNKVRRDVKLQKRFSDCQIVRWTDSFADVYPIDGGKDIGIKHILDAYTINLQDVLVFGDGGNDVSMLKYVPNSVAMGNAKDFVKESATYITDLIEDDGVYNALKRLEWI